MLNFITGGAGFGKSFRLMNIVNELADKTDKKIIFIVPEQFSFEQDKKLYKHLGAKKFNKIMSLSFTSLAKEIFERFGGRSGEYAEDMHKFILMNKAIKSVAQSGSLNCYERQSRRTGFINEVLTVVNELRQCSLTDSQISQLCVGNNISNEKIKDIMMIYSEYDQMLKNADLKDSLTDITEAAAIADGYDFFENTIIFFDEFESFTADQIELIKVMISQAEDVYIALRYEESKLGKYDIFETGMKTWAKLTAYAKSNNIPCSVDKCEKPLKYTSETLAFLNTHVLRPITEKSSVCNNLSITECGNLYEEAEFVCAQIKELVISHNYNYRDIAVISRQLEEYAYIFDSVFQKYDIPFFMDIKKNAMHTRLMQYIINTVNLITETSPSLETVLTFIKTSFSNKSFSDINVLEEYSYEWNLSGKDFFRPFTINTDKTQYAEECRKKFMEPVTELRKKCADADCADICRNLYSFLFDSKIPLNLSEINNELIEAGYVNQAKELKRIWDTLMKMLDVFAEIGGDIDVREFGNLFRAAAGSITFSTPPQTLDGVHIARAETARLASTKVLFIVGVNEGYFPHSISDNGLLNSQDRIKLCNAGIHLSRTPEELAADEKLVVYKSLTHASDMLFITYPLTDNTGADRYRSSVIDQICSLFSDNIINKASDKSLIFYSPTPQSAYSNFVRNFNKDNPDIASLRTALSEDDYYQNKISYLYEVSQQKSFAISDKELTKKLFGETLSISPTGFEMYHLCHFRFFCDKALSLKKPQRREFNPSEQGNIIHNVLENILSSYKTQQEFASLTENDIKIVASECVENYMQNNLGGDVKKSKRLKSIFNEVINNIVQIVLHLQNEFSQSEFFPVELEFEINNKVPVLTADNGVKIILNGRIDRVDMYENNGQKYIRVVDYKTGKTEFSLANVLYGINMQMILYLFSIISEEGKYKNCEPAGVLYMPSRELKNNRSRDSKDTIEKFLNDNYKMNGIVLRERNVISAMEKHIQGIYIPAKIAKGDSGEGELVLYKKTEDNCLSSEAFRQLRKHTETLLNNFANELYNGNVSANPLIIDEKKDNVCKYCDFWSVCGNDSSSDIREISKDAKQQLLIQLGEKKTDDDDNK